ncbi:MAG: methylmalonyl Co-A mutase-associated GTPase MeaB, partial [Fidelibacterota bacterium]
MNHIDIGEILNGSWRAIARAISAVENGEDEAFKIMDKIYSSTGRAYRIGVTGPPGVGKSTLVDKMSILFRKRDLTIGIIAVDPTSPFSGGALLGDRIRMSDLTVDGGVFIRSMASRGSMGGLARSAQEAADIMDAGGMDIVIFETVGVGQSELEIAQTADTTIVVLVPESGDEIQAMKAGLMEIADFFVLNKSDREGAERAYFELQSIFELKERVDGGWSPFIIKTVAETGAGVETVVDSIEKHRSYMLNRGKLGVKRRRRLEKRIKSLIEERVLENFWTPARIDHLENYLKNFPQGSLSPYELV